MLSLNSVCAFSRDMGGLINLPTRWISPKNVPDVLGQGLFFFVQCGIVFLREVAKLVDAPSTYIG